jgi:hypothetical protein
MKNVDKHVIEPLVGSCLVTPKGASTGIMAGALAGGAAGAAARAAVDTAAGAHGRGRAPLEAGTGTLGLLGLTADDVVLVNGRRGMIKPVATGLAGRAPRRDLVGAELGKGKLTVPLRLTWADGTEWLLDVPRAECKRAHALLGQLRAA